MYNYAALWVGMSVCIPTYMLASGLISVGMDSWQALGTILLGNMIVLVMMLLNAHAGARDGIPFPVLVRASFGVAVRTSWPSCAPSSSAAGSAFRRGLAGSPHHACLSVQDVCAVAAGKPRAPATTRRVATFGVQTAEIDVSRSNLLGMAATCLG